MYFYSLLDLRGFAKLDIKLREFLLVFQKPTNNNIFYYNYLQHSRDGAFDKCDINNLSTLNNFTKVCSKV